MAITINGNGTVTGVSVGGLPDGIVDTDMLATNAVATAKIADDAVTAAKRGTGSILQVVESGFSGSFQTASTSFTDVTNATIDITPTSASSKILLFVNLDSDYVAETNALRVIYTKLFRDSTAIYKQAWYLGHGTSSNGYGYYGTPIDMLQLDSPNTTSQVTYKVQAKIDSASNNAYFRVNMVSGQCESNLVAMEVAG